MKRIVILAGVLAAAGCSAYAPPVPAGAGPQYQTDLAACQTQSADAVDKQNAKTGLAWLASPVRRPFQIRAAIRACVQSKGYTGRG